MKDGGPWIVGGRTYREWRKVPLWFRKGAWKRRRYGDSLPTLERMRTLRMWRQTLFGAFLFVLLVFLVAEALWQL